MDIDSAGCSVSGVLELAVKIQGLRELKRIVAVANAQAASAAYWLAASASELVVTPSGEVGSIGVWSAHADMSKSLELEGVKVTLVSAGEFKTEGNPYESLGKEAKAEIQRTVNSYHNDFVADVAAGRGVPGVKVRTDFGKGRMLRARDALRARMIDRIDTLENVLRRPSSPGPPSHGRGSRAATARARLALAAVK